MRALLVWLAEVEVRAAMMLRPYALTLLRTSLGLVFVWFGALKVAHATPVADLVAGAVPWVDAAWFVPLLGAVEVVLGAALLVGRWLTVVAVALAAHLTGTFLVLLMEPHVAFQHGNPMLLTTAGEFVVKNLVLISAALVLASRLSDRHVRLTLSAGTRVVPLPRDPDPAPSRLIPAPAQDIRDPQVKAVR